jgi:hypothetical protein
MPVSRVDGFAHLPLSLSLLLPLLLPLLLLLRRLSAPMASPKLSAWSSWMSLPLCSQTPRC